MRHLDVRDLWLSMEVADGKVVVGKVRGDQKPADFMTNYLPGRSFFEWKARSNVCFLFGLGQGPGRGAFVEIAHVSKTSNRMLSDTMPPGGA